MKRKLPQWLLEATNNNDNSLNTNSPKTIRKTSKSTDNHNENDQPEQQNSNASKSDHISNGTINIVPIANLLSPSRCVIPTDRTITTKNVEINERIPRTESSSNLDISTNKLQPEIKTEKIDDIEPSTSNLNGNTVNNHSVAIKQEIKDEPADTVTNVPTVDVKVESVEVKPERPSCNYGIKCFRRNPSHRTEMAHPGDVDYRRPNFPDAPSGTPLCPWGAACYRRNRQHFIQLSHPPAMNNTTMNPNVNVNAMPQTHSTARRNRQNNQRVVNTVDSDEEDDYDLEDPFIDDGSSDEYVPNEVDDETDDDLEDQG